MSSDTIIIFEIVSFSLLAIFFGYMISRDIKNKNENENKIKEFAKLNNIPFYNYIKIQKVEKYNMDNKMKNWIYKLDKVKGLFFWLFRNHMLNYLSIENVLLLKKNSNEFIVFQKNSQGKYALNNYYSAFLNRTTQFPRFVIKPKSSLRFLKDFKYKETLDLTDKYKIQYDDSNVKKLINNDFNDFLKTTFPQNNIMIIEGNDKGVVITQMFPRLYCIKSYKEFIENCKKIFDLL